VFYPLPPDTAKIQFLTSINSSSDVIGEQTGFEKYIVGPQKEEPIIKPYGIAAAKNKLYFVDTKLNMIGLIDFSKKSFEFFNPEGGGQLKKPINCFIDNNLLYINDIERKDIVVLNENRELVKSFGKDIFSKPIDVFCYKDRIYVSDMELHKVFVFSKDNYQLLNSFPNVPKDSVEFLHSPIHFFVANDKIYICDFGEFHIKIFDLNGKYLKSLGSYGKNIGQFARPKGIAIDADKNLYVLDAAFDNAQIFNDDGKLLMYFGNSASGKGNLNLPIRVAIDYDNVDYFKEFVDGRYSLKYLIYVTNQFGDNKINVYGFIEPKK